MPEEKPLPEFKLLWKEYFLPRLKGTFIIRIAYILLGFGISLILTRNIGAEGYGAYSYAFSIVYLLSLPCTFGFNKLITREIAIYLEKSDFGAIRGLIKYSTRLVILTSFGVLFISLFLLFPFNYNLDPIIRDSLMIGLIVLPAYSLIHLFQGTMLGFHKTVQSQLPESIFRPLLTILFFGIAILSVKEGLTPQLAVGLNVGANIIVLVLFYVYMRKSIPIEVFRTKPVIHSQKWLRSGLAFLFISGMYIINTHTDIIMIGSMLGAEEAGIYNIPNRINSFLVMIFLIGNLVLNPLISRYHAKGEHNKLQQLMVRSIRLIISLTLPLSIILLLFKIPILNFFGVGFDAGATVLVIFIVFTLVNISMGSVSILLTMTGHEKLSAYLIMISAGINIVLNFILIPKMGIEGAAIATGISYIAWKLLLSYYAAKKLKIYPSVLGKMF